MAVKFTEKAEQVLLAAGNEAKRRTHNFVGTEHILYGILGQNESIAVRAICGLECDPAKIQKATDEALERVPSAPHQE